MTDRAFPSLGGVFLPRESHIPDSTNIMMPMVMETMNCTLGRQMALYARSALTLAAEGSTAVAVFSWYFFIWETMRLTSAQFPALASSRSRSRLLRMNVSSSALVSGSRSPLPYHLTFPETSRGNSLKAAPDAASSRMLYFSFSFEVPASLALTLRGLSCHSSYQNIHPVITCSAV